jgi:hypothetical protein
LASRFAKWAPTPFSSFKPSLNLADLSLRHQIAGWLRRQRVAEVADTSPHDDLNSKAAI